MSVYGNTYDRYVAHNEQSTLHKMKETYWNTKQAVYKKLGKKQDEHIVASDSLLDSKLELFRAIQKNSIDLLKAVEKYQDRLCILSQEENAMGRFLKAEGQLDKTRAGKMMGAVGKAQSFSSQQRLSLRVPLVRLYQEVETFRYRAISDTLMTINRMESARTEYRGALMWMKDVSEVLDPDTFKQLEKFRKVQAQVKKTKARFDKLKLDTMQKIDLLAASRCNMFSHVLANYQSTLLHFWSKTSRTMTAVAESFKGYQYYEFNMLKELAEPSKKLAEETGNRLEPDRDVDGDGFLFDEEEGVTLSYEKEEHPVKLEKSDQGQHDRLNGQVNTTTVPSIPNSRLFDDDDDLLGLHDPPDFSYEKMMANSEFNPADLLSDNPPEKTGTSQSEGQMSGYNHGNAGLPRSEQQTSHSPHSCQGTYSTNTQQGGASVNKDHVSSPTDSMPINNKQELAEAAADSGLIELNYDSHPDAASLIDIDQKREGLRKQSGGGSLTNLLQAIDKEIERPGEGGRAAGATGDDPFLDFGDEEDLEVIKRKQEEQFDFSGKFLSSAQRPAHQSEPDGKKGKAKQNVPKDLLSDDLEQDDLEKDDLTLLNEILNGPSAEGDDFTKEWQAVFGVTPLSTNTNINPGEPDQSPSGADFMPSNLLDQRMITPSALPGGQPRRMPSGVQQPAMMTGQAAAGQAAAAKAKNKKGQKNDMSAWFNLFADLDPLSNPDAIGRTGDEMTDA